MNNKFPLYNSLKNRIAKDTPKLTAEGKIALAQKIKNFDKHAQELVYALIKAHSLSHENIVTGLPYKGKILKSGPKFDLEELPCELQLILCKFSELHLSSHQN